MRGQTLSSYSTVCGLIFLRSYAIVFVSNQNYAPHTKAHQRFRAKAPLIAASVSDHITPQKLH